MRSESVKYRVIKLTTSVPNYYEIVRLHQSSSNLRILSLGNESKCLEGFGGLVFISQIIDFLEKGA